MPGFRGTAVGTVGAGLAVAAHGAGGGAIPGSAAFTLLIGVCVAVGVGAARIGGRASLLVGLATIQAAGHIVLALADHPHGLPLTPPMLAAHTLAVLGCGLLILAAERLYAAAARAIRAAGTPPAQEHGEGRAALLPTTALVLRSILLGAISLRGPPASA